MEKHAIKKLTRDFVEAYDRRDAAAAAELYAEDAKLLPPNMEIVIGKQAIQAFWNGAMQMGAQIDLKAVEVVADEALVYCFPNFVIFRPTMLALNSWPDNPVKPFSPKCGELTKR